VRRGPEERVDDLGRELGAGPGADLGKSLLVDQRGAVQALGRHRVPRLGQSGDCGLERDLLAGDAVRVALAAPALVVVADDRHGLLEPAERWTRIEWPAVFGSFASTVAFRLSIAACELSSSCW
jgi:hypothetical protein